MGNQTSGSGHVVGAGKERLFDSFSSQFEDGVLTLEHYPRIAFIDNFPICFWYSLMSWGACRCDVGSQVLSLSG
jgi:hypothetical protein